MLRLKRNKIVLIITLVPWLSFCSIAISKPSGEELTLSDIFEKSAFSVRSVWGMKFLKDGNHFSKTVHNNNSGRSDILSFDLTTGEVYDTIFKGEWLVPQDSTEAVRFGAYNLSRDESKVLLPTEMESIYRHSTREYNYIWHRDKKYLQPLSIKGKQRYAKFSPDGSRIGFIRDNNLFITDLETNQETQVTFDGEVNNIINGATDWVYEEEFGFTRAFFWSSEGNRIAYYRFDESKVRSFSMPIYGDLYPEDYIFKYPKAGEKNAIITIHVYDLKSNKTSTIDIGEEQDQYIPRIKWTKNPELLSIQRMNRHQNKLELLMVNTSSGKVTTVLAEENDKYIDVTDDLTFLDDMIHFIWTSEKSGYNHIYQYTLGGTLVRQITTGDWDVTRYYGVDEANNKIYYQSTEESPLEKHIYSIFINGKGIDKLSKRDGINRADFTPNFAYYILYHSDANTPTRVALYTSEGTQIRSMEDNAELVSTLGKYDISKKEFFTFKTSEGTHLNGWMIKPPDFNPKKKYPLLMYVYGGPGSQTVTNSWDGRGFIWYQYLAQQGYIIASVDNRGTGSRGEKFKKMTYLKLGKYETEDQIEAAKYLGDLRYVDKDRIGIWGWSYGGYMAAMCITLGADVFKMAIAVAPVTHWKFYDTIYTERFMRTPEENPEGYEEGAPISYADKLKGNFLMIHATADDNVHFQNTVEMVDALIKANKQFDLAIYPNKKHGITGRLTHYQLYTKMTDYILGNL